MFVGSKIGNWEFLFARDQVDAQAKIMLVKHTDRHAFWSGEVDRLEGELREKGINLVTYDHSGGRGFNAVVDPQYAESLGQARSRAAYHDRRMKLMGAIITALALSDGDDGLQLSLSDVVSFGFVATDLDDEDAADL